MTIDEHIKLRLQFLSRVVQRECEQLQRTTARLFIDPFTIERAQLLTIDDDLSECVEAFVSRFSRFQDTVGDKLIPQLLKALGEKPAAVMVNLDTAERLEWIESADEWQAIRQLRNQMVHDYIEDLEVLSSAIQTAQEFVPMLIRVADNLQNELQKRGWNN